MDSSSRLKFLLGTLRVHSDRVSAEEWALILDEIPNIIMPLANYVAGFSSMAERNRSERPAVWCCALPDGPDFDVRLLFACDVARVERCALYLSEKGEWIKVLGEESGRRVAHFITVKDVVDLGMNPLKAIEGLTHAVLEAEQQHEHIRKRLRDHRRALSSILRRFEDSVINQ